MKLKMKIKIKYKAFMFIYKPEMDTVKTPANIIKPVFNKNPQPLALHVAARA